MQRILLARSLLAARHASEHRAQRGGPRVRPARAAGARDAGGDQLVQDGGAEPARRERRRAGPGRAGRLGARSARRRRRAGGGRRAVPRRRLLGPPTRSPSGWPGPPTWTSTALVVVAGRPAGGRRRRLDLRWAAVTLDGRRSLVAAARADGRPARGQPPSSPTSTSTPPMTSGAGRRAAGPGPALLDAARHARPRDRPDPGVRAGPRAVRPAAGRLPGRPVPADRRRGRAGRRGSARQVRALERPGQASRTRSPTRWRCGWRRSKRPRSCSGSRTSCTARSGSATRRTLSWLSRYSQPLRRLPLGLSATRRRS